MGYVLFAFNNEDAIAHLNKVLDVADCVINNKQYKHLVQNLTDYTIWGEACSIGLISPYKQLDKFGIEYNNAEKLIKGYVEKTQSRVRDLLIEKINTTTVDYVHVEINKYNTILMCVKVLC